MYSDILWFGHNSLAKPDNITALMVAVDQEDGAEAVRPHADALADFERKRVEIVNPALVSRPRAMELKLPSRRVARTGRFRRLAARLRRGRSGRGWAHQARLGQAGRRALFTKMAAPRARPGLTQEFAKKVVLWARRCPPPPPPAKKRVRWRTRRSPPPPPTRAQGHLAGLAQPTPATQRDEESHAACHAQSTASADREEGRFAGQA